MQIPALPQASLSQFLSAFLRARFDPNLSLKILFDRYGPMFYAPFRLALLIGSAEVAKAIQSKPDHIKKVDFTHPIDPFAKNAVGQNEKDWERSRSGMIRSFSPVVVVNQYSSLIAREIDALFDRFESHHLNRAFDPSAFLDRWMFDLLSSVAFGEHPHAIDDDKHPLYRAVVKDTFGSGLYNPFKFWKQGRAIKGIKAHFERCYAKCMENIEIYPDCALKEMIKLNTQNSAEMKLEKEEIRDNLVAVYRAGWSGLVSLLAWVLTAVGHRQDVQRRCREEARLVSSVPTKAELNQAEYCSALIKEINRMWPPIPFLFPRKMTTPIQGENFSIPENQLLIVWLSYIQRNPTLWGDDVDSFNPDRFLKNSDSYRRTEAHAWLTFGTGRRACPGSHLSVTILEMFLLKLVARFQVDSPRDGSAHSQVGSKANRYSATFPQPLRITLKKISAASLLSSESA